MRTAFGIICLMLVPCLAVAADQVSVSPITSKILKQTSEFVRIKLQADLVNNGPRMAIFIIASGLDEKGTVIELARFPGIIMETGEKKTIAQTVTLEKDAFDRVVSWDATMIETIKPPDPPPPPQPAGK